MSDDMLRVHIKGVAMPSTDASPIVILEETRGLGEFYVGVGASEAGAILMNLEGVSTPRPLTHDLMAQILQEQGISLHRVELYGLYGSEEDRFLARLEYGKGFRRWTRDVRPSDALALAVITGAPIFAHQSLIAQASAEADRPSVLEPEAGYWFMPRPAE